MQEEYLDIVDENGNLTGKKELRSIVHKKGLWHRVVVIYVYRLRNNNLELLVHQRSKNKEQNPNKWDTRFGGHIETGLTIEEALKKEAQEEIGILVDLKKIIKVGKKTIYSGADNKEIGQIFYYEFNDDIKKLSFNDGEVQKVQWMTESKIAKSMDHNPESWTGRKITLHDVIKDIKNKL